MYLPISALLKFDMKMFVNIARLDIYQMFTQSVRQGHPCTSDTFLVSEEIKLGSLKFDSVSLKRMKRYKNFDIQK